MKTLHLRQLIRGIIDISVRVEVLIIGMII